MNNTQADGTNLVVVDGSNIATEGRSIPSLAQLNDAVISLTDEFPDITVTVVVDATFGHRIDKSEVSEFDEAVAHNELVSPPAGAIGRGDAFVLSIANKVGARIFSNDSFQEFHGVYPWLFDEGRLIGGKPVPNVGWVFVNRVPVKGPLSRKARGAGRDGGTVRRPASPMASLPMPIPTSPPPRSTTKVAAEAAAPVSAQPPSSGRGRRRKVDDVVGGPESVPPIGRETTAPPSTNTVAPSGGPVNDLLPFLDFIQSHPVGSSVTGSVESYSSHGAYVTIGDLRGYVPLRLMGSPPPRSAREVMRSGEEVALVVASFAPARRSVDLAVPGMAESAAEEPAPSASSRGRRRARVLTPDSAEIFVPSDVDESEPPGRRRASGRPRPAAAAAAASTPASRGRARKAGATTAVSPPLVDGVEPTAPRVTTTVPPATAQRPRARTTAAEVDDDPMSPPAAVRPRRPATDRSATASSSVSRAPSDEGARRVRRAKQSAVAPTEPTAPPPASEPVEPVTAPAKKSAAKRSAAQKSPAKTPPAKTTTATKSPATKSSAKTTTATKSPAKTPLATKSPAKTTLATKSPAKKSTATDAAATDSATATNASASSTPRATGKRAAATKKSASAPPPVEADPAVSPASRRRRTSSALAAEAESS